MSAKVINVGSINIDHVYHVPHFVMPGETLSSDSLATGLGGKGANQSVALAKAGVGVAHVGQVGVADNWAIQEMASAGVNTDWIKSVEQASGHAIIQVDSNGENAIVLHGGANQSLSADELHGAIKANAGAEYLLLQNECNLLQEAIDIAFSHSLNVVLNPAPMTAQIKELPLERIDTLIVNQGEAQALFDCETVNELIAASQAKLPKTRVVLTLGADGVVLIHQNQTLRVAPPKVNAVDTTGAGDTFVGYFLASVVQGKDAQQGLDFACRAAALAVTRMGAISAIPDHSELS